MARNPTLNPTPGTIDAATRLERAGTEKVQGKMFMVAVDDEGMRVLFDNGKTCRLKKTHENYATMASMIIAAQSGGTGFITAEVTAPLRAMAGQVQSVQTILAVGLGVSAVVLGAL
jgi:hypothetical protein